MESHLKVGSPADAKWAFDHYEDLVMKYGGKYVLIRDQKVVFADVIFDQVWKHATRHFPDNRWEIWWIESGEAVFY